MGYAVHRFPIPIDENLVCGICSAVLDTAVLTPCGHSFCQLCLDTWLARPGPGSCPECRGRVGPTDARPILAVRNLINSLDIECEYRPRGCPSVLRLDNLSGHLHLCPYAPVECAGCGSVVDRGELAAHHVQCDGVLDAMLRAATTGSSGDMQRLEHNGPVSDLACRVAGLEFQARKMRRELLEAQARNTRLQQELGQARDELRLKRSQLLEQQCAVVDPDYEYGFTSASIVELACVLARYLLARPAHVDKDRVYEAIKRCYENYGRGGSAIGGSGEEFEHDVLMLLATANASNWFSSEQKANIQCWLKCLNRYSQYKNQLAAL